MCFNSDMIDASDRLCVSTVEFKNMQREKESERAREGGREGGREKGREGERERGRKTERAREVYGIRAKSPHALTNTTNTLRTH